MKRTPLYVSLHAHEPSIVELTLGDRVQLDRVIPAPRGYLAERQGPLLAPGMNTRTLSPGHYFFKTLSDAHLCVVSGGVVASVTGSGKDPWPQPPPPPPPAGGQFPPPVPNVEGDELPGESPRFTIEPADPVAPR